MATDWQLPPGVSRALWDHLHDPASARLYDRQLADTPLLALDIQYVRHWCRPPGSIIDLGCGTGRLAIVLAGKGYRPVAVDLSPEMLRVLGDKAASLGLDIPRVQANLVELDAIADQSFDHAACLFSTLGLIEGSAHRRRFLQHVYRLLRPGGVFVLHVHNRWFHLWTRAGRRLLCRNLFGGDFVMPAHQGTGPLNMHLFTRGEIVRELRTIGFHVREVRPVSVRPDGKVPWSFLFSGWRAYGFLVAAVKWKELG
ncbi:MAG TPA: methyltransferase domain-containing protein [Gemmataceae bacterium]|jgi:SAM-dependent methyltransferase|nr:methyltransferase domain-containing protein [Gemmataceae bacterium]